MQLTTAVQSLTNSIAFDQTDTKADNITATFRMKIDSGGLADGMTFALLDVDTYSSSGPFEAPLADTIYYEEPNFPGTLAIGFDIYDGGEEANPDYIDEVDPDGCGGDGACLDARANHVSVHWDGAIVGKAVRSDLAEFDLINGQWNDVTVLAEQVEGGMNVTVAIVDADGKKAIGMATGCSRAVTSWRRLPTVVTKSARGPMWRPCRNRRPSCWP